jgi:succinate dehydrogenase / fumarate reductase, cytochrome b subunit
LSLHRGKDRQKGDRYMADANRANRPLSPHLTIYRPQWTSMTSILTRITGNALIVGTALVVWWFIAAASGPGAYALADAVITSWFGDLVMILSVWALWYHLMAGVRHLIWDSGRMLDIGAAELSGKVIVGASVVLTVLTVLILRMGA